MKPSQLAWIMNADKENLLIALTLAIHITYMDRLRRLVIRRDH